MITNKEIQDWIKTILPGLPIYNSTIDKNKDESIGIYSRTNGRVQPTAVGTRSTYGYKSLTFLIRWSRNANTCEQKAIEIWNTIRDQQQPIDISGWLCYFTANRAPVSLGKDEQGVFEQTLDMDLTFRRKD